MNKWVWVIIIAVLIIIGIFAFRGGDDTDTSADSGGSTDTIDGYQTSDLDTLATPDDDFASLDSAVDLIE